MSAGLGWLGIGVGLIGFIYLYFAASRSSLNISDSECSITGKSSRASAFLILLITIIPFGISMLNKPPFSPGQGLGTGYLIGGLCGFIVASIFPKLTQFSKCSEFSRTAHLTGLCAVFFALAGASIIYKIFPNDPAYPLMGFMIAAVMSAFILHYANSIFTRNYYPHAEIWAIASCIFASSIILAQLHFAKTQLREWWAMPILIASTMLVAVYISAELLHLSKLNARKGLAFALALLASLIITICLGAIFSWKLYNDWRLFETMAIGAAVYSIITWLAFGVVYGSGRSVVDVASGMTLLAVGFMVVAFSTWSGLGVGIGLIAAGCAVLLVLGLSRSGENVPKFDLVQRAAIAALGFGLSMLMFRLFIEAYRGPLGRLDLRIHYTFIGAIIGIILPFVFISSLSKLREFINQPISTGVCIKVFFNIGALGLFAAASPILIQIIWGLKAVLGLMFGLAASGTFLLFTFVHDAIEDRLERSFGEFPGTLLIIAAQLSAIQFVRLLIKTELTRMVRIEILAIAAIVFILWQIALSITSTRQRA